MIDALHLNVAADASQEKYIVGREIASQLLIERIAY
jgi:hypothetical protein